MQAQWAQREVEEWIYKLLWITMLSFPSSSKYTIETQIDYCMSKKSRPNLYSNLIYEMGPDFLDIQ